MQANTLIRSALFSLLLTATGAYAALDLDKHVQLSDAFGGHVSLQTSGSVDLPGSELTTDAVFTDFHPGGENRRVSGDVIRERVRNAEQVVSVYTGELVFDAVDTQGEPLQATLVFEQLRVTREGAGPELAGTVLLNGREIDAAEMPEAVAAILVGVLRFFHHA
jgi:hypothetical protein